jgi:hypothetical protein
VLPDQVDPTGRESNRAQHVARRYSDQPELANAR